MGPILGRSLVGGAGRCPKRSTKLPAIEERRLLVAPGEGSGGLLRSEEDIVCEALLLRTCIYAVILNSSRSRVSMVGLSRAGYCSCRTARSTEVCGGLWLLEVCWRRS